MKKINQSERKEDELFQKFSYLIMKLTQKTLFQCFDKSQRQSPIILDDKDEGKRLFLNQNFKFESCFKIKFKH